jgi:hypothetical protein
MATRFGQWLTSQQYSKSTHDFLEYNVPGHSGSDTTSQLSQEFYAPVTHIPRKSGQIVGHLKLKCLHVGSEIAL